MSVTDSLLAFSFAALLLTLTPGLDTALILRTSAAEGGKKAFQAALGINAGCLIWGALVALGLGALLAASELAYSLLKWCGAAWLCWLGLQLILRPRRAFDAGTAAPAAGNWFLKGMFGNVLNPKIGVFYVSFLPQFIPSGHSPAVWTFLLVGIHVLLGTLWSLTLIMATRYASGLLKAPGVYPVDGPGDGRRVYALRRAAGAPAAARPFACLIAWAAGPIRGIYLISYINVQEGV
ncbi:Homoserine/homoserine lactone efflux protein [Raoultella terrigena]|uniref:Homoserine/homoserine lactone efflux protein n=1 Tax=Raoultella terrigena TaxID=577 RepID=A0A3P8JK34_RAOTE|nr:Homoserine/homoserine lactone efflux protein [Raoultella terrigena]